MSGPLNARGPLLHLNTSLNSDTSVAIKCLTKKQTRSPESLTCLLASDQEYHHVLDPFFTYMKSLIHLTVDLFPEVLTSETHKHRKKKKKKETKKQKKASN